jgi:hypothetical protein
MDTPAKAVRSFIEAHTAWEVRANERAKTLLAGSEAYQVAVELAEAEYEEMLSRLCAPSVVRQGISFGGDPMHHPERETIESASVTGDLATVLTRHAGRHDFVSEYDYHLVRQAGEWRIASVLYLDEDGTHECL